MKQLTPEMKSFIESMPKAEIHIHLEGAIQPETVLQLARRHNMLDVLPGNDVAALRNWFTFTNFPHFIEIYVTIQELIRTAEDFELIAYENGRDMAAQNILYRECTVTTYTHTHSQNKMTIDDILRGLENGRNRAKQDFGVEMRWVFDIPRNLGFTKDGDYFAQCGEIALEQAILGKDVGVVGFGLGGNEVGAPPKPFADVFVKAKEAGLLSVPHAGETTGAQSIWDCLHDLQADRIGHGVRAVEDPQLLNYLKESQTPLEINPTSNQCLHVFPEIASHPFAKLDEMGIFVTVNSDDPPLFNSTLQQEYELLATQFDYDQKNLARIARNAFEVIGAETAVKQKLLQKFDLWQNQTLL